MGLKHLMRWLRGRGAPPQPAPELQAWIDAAHARWDTPPNAPPHKFRPLLADLESQCYAETRINGVTKRTRVTCPWEKAE
jgi:hypothetical protein